MNARIRIKRTIDDGYQYTCLLGFPVILKPNNLSQGTLVTKVYNKTEYYSVAKKILKKVGVMVVERFYPGNDYRIVVLDSEVISVYQRIPCHIFGDGRSSIGTLLRRKQEYFDRTGRDTIIDLADYRLRLKLKRNRYSMRSVPNAGQKVFLLDNANLSTGGDAVDVTEKLHRDFHRLAVRITKDMGLRMCGVDIITRGEVSQPLKDYVVIEINSAPGLDNYASIGMKQKKKVDELYLKVLEALQVG